MELIIPSLIELLTVVIYILITAATGALTLWIKQKWGIDKMKRISEQMHNEESLAYRALMLVKESLIESGLVTDNLATATEWLSQELRKKGIKLTSQQIQDLLTSVFNQFKDSFIEDWEEITVQDQKTGEIITYQARRVI